MKKIPSYNQISSNTGLRNKSAIPYFTTFAEACTALASPEFFKESEGCNACVCGREASKNNKSGIILLVVLWTLVILTMLAVGLGRRAAIELALTKHAIGKLRSKYIALAGLNYALKFISADNVDEDAKQFDSKYQCGFPLKEDILPETIFQDVKIKDGFFNVSYAVIEDDGQVRRQYGLADEESKININALTPENYGLLTYLIMEFGFEQEAAETTASSVVDWIDQNDDVFHEPYGAEDEYYTIDDNGYPCKNRYFNSLHEILLVRGMTPEIFSRLQNFITVFPQEGRFLINLSTSADAVIKAYAKSLSGAATNTTLDDAQSLAEKIIEYRKGDDSLFATADDRKLDVNEMALNPKEQVLYLMMMQNQTLVSNFLRVTVKGEDNISHIHSTIEAVIKRDDLSILYWNRR